MKIREYLRHTGLTKAQFARQIGVHVSNVYRWIEQEESNSEKGSLSPENIVKIVNGTNGLISADELLAIKKRKAKAA